MSSSVAEVWVKVCGLTDRGDVEHAVAAGADAVGVVVYEGSPRYVEPKRVAALVAEASVMTVMLTVDLPSDIVLQLSAESGVTAIQPYGRHAVESARRAIGEGLAVLRPTRIVPGFVLPEDDGSIPLLDTPHDALHGGTGTSFDWDLVAHVERNFVLAGGLGPDNVRRAIDRARPWGVDASSALEATPGKKDLSKVTAFIEEAKRR